MQKTKIWREIDPIQSYGLILYARSRDLLEMLI